jgi:putative transport protein
MDWIATTLTRYPELAVFTVVGIGYWVGAFKFHGFGLGPVTGSLLVGLLLGAVVTVPVSSTAKSLLFLLFLFAIGYSVGPKFFQAMKGDGLRWAALAVVQCVVGLLVAYAVARAFEFDPGFAGGLLSGALTESPAIGTATEAINSLPLPEAERARLVSHVAVADAICYVFGAFGVILFCGTIGPKLLGIDVRKESERVEKELGLDRSKPGVYSAWRPVEFRAYRLRPDSPAAGRTIAEAEAMAKAGRVFIERIRREDALLESSPEVTLRSGDVVALSARRDVLVNLVGEVDPHEVEDRELLDMPATTYDVFVTSDTVVGKTLREIADSGLSMRSVFLRSITRGGVEIPVAPLTKIERGDVVRLTGPEQAVARAAGEIGKAVLPSDATDFVSMSLAIVAGALVGILLVVPLGELRIPLGTSVGTLLAGLLVGYAHSRRPHFARIPDGAIELMKSLGLAAFVAMIGLGAGPHFMEALRTAGVGLFFGGIIVTSVPLLVGLYFGRYVLKLDPLLLLGGIAGAQTMAAGYAAVQEQSGSSVAVLGYSATVAPGHILLTIWGTVIVQLVAP